VVDWTELFTNKLKSVEALKVMGTDLLHLTLAKTPREMGAHVTYGNT
jgi:glycine dehydrogenase